MSSTCTQHQLCTATPFVQCNYEALYEAPYVGKLVRQKRNLEQDFIIIKKHIAPIIKNVKYHSSIFINIMATQSWWDWWLAVHINWIMWNTQAVEREGNILARQV